jgi:hypothetical protein
MTLSINNTNLGNVEWHYAECFVFYCYAECHYDGCHFAEGRYAECHYAECRGTLIILLSPNAEQHQNSNP